MGEYFDHTLGDITDIYQPEDTYPGGLFGALEKLYMGTTTALNWSSPDTLEHGERAVDALTDARVSTPSLRPAPNSSRSASRASGS